jgi:hypothetical protein
MNVNYNNLYCDYIGATGAYSISDYIDITSINSSNFTLGTSNILNDKIDTTSNFILNRYDKLIKEQTENSLINTYITNSNVGGEIIFYVKNSGIYDIYNATGQPYRVKIGTDGKLYLYYNYNIAIGALETERWVEPINMIIGHNVALGNLNVITGATDITVGSLIIKVNMLDARTTAANLISNSEVFYNPNSTYDQLRLAYNTIKASFTYANTIYATIVGSLGFGITFAIYGFVQSKINADYIYNNLNYQLTSNTTMTPEEKNQLIEESFNAYSSNLNDMNTNLRNLSDFNGCINYNITTEQYIKTLKCDTLNLNTGNISNINGIIANEIIANGKIKQNNILLDNTYLTSNHLYNLAYNYTAERQYPSKAYTTSSIEEGANLLNKLVYKQTLFLDNQSIAYGLGYYEIYSSSTYDIITKKDRLFNFNTTETTTSPRWAISLYNSGTGNYQGDNSIDGSYFGDWVILKLPKEILLTRYRIYQRSDFPTKAPAEWKCYGSNDGIIFTEITEASQMTRLTSYTSGFYEKSLNSSFTTQYQYIGFVFNKLLSSSGQTDLSFAELQLFGKEIISNTITSSIYATSNAVKNIIIYDTPVVCKHFAFYINITTPIIINTKTYYKYDIDLRQYTKLGYIEIGSQSGDSYRIFKLRACYGSMYFSTLVNGLPNVVYSDIFMSMKANPTANLGAAGLNICSIGSINNPRLDIVPSNNLFFMRNGANSIDYITVVSTNIADVRCFIEDMIS